MAQNKAVVSSATPAITTEVVSQITAMLGLADDHKALIAGITAGGAEGLSHSVTEAMAALGDTDAAGRAVTAAQGLLKDAKRAVDAHTNYRVSIVAAIRKVDPKMTKTAIAELMYGKTGTSAAKTQIGRDFDNLDAMAAVGRFNLAAKAKGQQTVAMTRAQAAKALRDRNATERKAILKALETTGTVPADAVTEPVRKTKGSTVVRDAGAVVTALKTLNPEEWSADQRAEVLRLLGEATALATKAPIAKAAAQATKTA